MSRVCSLIADVHQANHHRMAKIGGEFRSGLNERAREIAKCLALATEKSAMDRLIIAGDLFDTADPTPEVVTAAMAALFTRTALLVGNHDQSSYDEGHHALGPFSEDQVVFERPGTIYWRDADKDNFEVVMVPFRNKPGAEHLRHSLSEALASVRPSTKRSLLVMHMGIEDAKTPPWLCGSRNSIGVNDLVEILDQFGIDDCAAGDWHQHRLWKIGKHNITQIGALCPTGWDNPGLEGYGSLIHWHDDGHFEREEIPGPRFVTEDVGEAPEGFRYYRRVSIQHVDEAKQYRETPDTEVAFDRKATAAASEKAAASVRNVGNLQERVSAYCQETLSAELAPRVTDAVLYCLNSVSTS